MKIYQRADLRFRPGAVTVLLALFLVYHVVRFLQWHAGVSGQDSRAQYGGVAGIGGPVSWIQDRQTLILFGMSVSYVVPPRLANCTTLPIGVLSGYAERRQAVRSTYGKNACVYFVVGKRDGVWPEQEAIEWKDIIMIDLEEVYHGERSILPHKTALWFHVANRLYSDASYILKTDDDSYVAVRELELELARVKPDYWGHVFHGAKPYRDPQSKYFVPVSMWPDDVYPDYCGGAGYVLSRKALGCMATTMASEPYFPPEDVRTGIVAQKCRVKPTHTLLVDPGGFEPSNPWVIKGSY